MPETFNLNVTASEVQIIGAALENMPYKVVALLINKINAQLSEQQKPEHQLPA